MRTETQKELEQKEKRWGEKSRTAKEEAAAAAKDRATAVAALEARAQQLEAYVIGCACGQSMLCSVAHCLGAGGCGCLHAVLLASVWMWTVSCVLDRDLAQARAASQQAVEQLQSERKALEAKVSAMEASLAALEASKAALLGDRDSAQRDLSSQVDKLQR